MFIDSEKLEQEAYVEELFQVDAILVPGGFGKRGIEGMIRAIEFARGHKVPFFGICLGPADRGDRVRPQRLLARARQLHRSSSPTRRTR